jgi:hypothetical protein
VSFFAEPSEASKAGNAMIRQALNRTRSHTLGQRDNPPVHGERLSRALNDSEAAQRSGDPDAIAFTEHRLDEVVRAARAARTERPRNPDGTYASFDGGVRGGRRSFEPSSTGQESANALMQRALDAARREAQDQHDDPGTTTYA